MQEQLKKYGPWAIITGASSGIGEEFSRQLAALGFNLVLVARRKERLESISAELTSLYKVETQVVALDLAQNDFINSLDTAIGHKEIGLLINNAGFALTGNFLDHEVEQEISLLHLNCRAPVLLAHFFGKKMAQRKQGGIINVASAAAFLPMPMWTNYSSSKSYLLHFSEGLAWELKSSGVDVMALCPGSTQTEFSAVAGVKKSGMQVSTVVQSAIQSLGKKTIVVPSFFNFFVTLLVRLLPRSWTTQIGASAVQKMIHD